MGRVEPGLGTFQNFSKDGRNPVTAQGRYLLTDSGARLSQSADQVVGHICGISGWCGWLAGRADPSSALDYAGGCRRCDESRLFGDKLEECGWWL
jgi:hypothetical protein